jgi:hypothetical protein
MQDDLTLLLTLDVQAVGQDALASVAAELQAIATQSGLALQAVTPLGDAFAGLVGGAAGLGAALTAGLAGIDWQGAGTALANGLGQAWDDAVAAFPAGEAAAELTTLVGNILGGIDWTIATNGPGQLTAAAGAVLAALDQALGNFVPEAVTRGSQIVGGLWQGIASRAGWLTANVPVWLDTNVLTPVETFFGISGVSAVMAGIGIDLVQGLMEGMTGLAGALLATAGALVAPLPAALLAFQADFSDVGASLMESVRDGILSKAGEIADQARAVVQGAIDAARSVLNGIESSIGAAQATLSGLGGAATVGHNAGGTDFWRGGLTWVGENGPELVNLPRGAQVLPLSGPAALPPGAAGGTTINVSVSGNTVLSDQDADLLASRVGQAIVRQTGLAYSLVR